MAQQKFTTNDLNYMSYHEFGYVMDILLSKLRNYTTQTGIVFDAVVPILRSGGVPGSIIGINLGIFDMIPIQLRYDTGRKEISTLYKTPHIKLKDNPNILICDAITRTGKTALRAIEVISNAYDECNIFLAMVCKATGGFDDFKDANEYFYGIETNDLFKLRPEEAKEKNIRQRYTVFPWENPYEELNFLNS